MQQHRTVPERNTNMGKRSLKARLLHISSFQPCLWSFAKAPAVNDLRPQVLVSEKRCSSRRHAQKKLDYFPQTCTRNGVTSYTICVLFRIYLNRRHSSDPTRLAMHAHRVCLLPFFATSSKTSTAPQFAAWLARQTRDRIGYDMQGIFVTVKAPSPGDRTRRHIDTLLACGTCPGTVCVSQPSELGLSRARMCEAAAAV
jgi:hypothetical protein